MNAALATPLAYQIKMELMMDEKGIPAIWQVENLVEYRWVRDVFGNLISDDVYDGQHKIVLNDCFLIDNYLYSRSADYYQRFKGKNVFLIHLSDETYEGGYEFYSIFRGVFRNY
jgi:hypothetical protein